MSKEKVDFSQFPDSSIPVYYSTPRGYLTYTGQVIPKHLSKKVYLLSPKAASKTLDLIPYQEYLNGDITKEDKFIHKEYGKKMDFNKINRSVQMNLRYSDANVIEIFNDLIKNFPFTIKEKPKKLSIQEVKEERFKTELGYRFDLDYD